MLTEYLLGLFGLIWYVGGQYILIRVRRADDAIREAAEREAA